MRPRRKESVPVESQIFLQLCPTSSSMHAKELRVAPEVFKEVKIYKNQSAGDRRVWGLLYLINPLTSSTM